MTKLITTILLLTDLAGYAQVSGSRVAGKYSDYETELELKADGSFTLKTADYVFPYTYDSYQSKGVWTASSNVVTLNPGKEKRKPQVYLTEKSAGRSDSIRVKINYFVETYENEAPVSREPADFHMLTLYVNKHSHYLNLVRAPQRRVCTFTPRIRKQLVVDSGNVVTFPKQRVERLGVYTYGFDRPIELTSTDPAANYFEIDIIQPVDKDRMPRGKKVVIKHNRAYFYERHNEVVTSGLTINSLKKVD